MSLVQAAAFPVIGRPVSKPLTGPAYTGSTRHYFRFANNTAINTGSATYATGGPYELSIKFCTESVAATQIAFRHNGGVTRLRLLDTADLEWRINSGTVIETTTDLVANTDYQVVITDALGDGTVDIVITNLRTGLVHQAVQGTTTSIDVTGATALGQATSGYMGKMWDIKWSEAGILLYKWSLDEGDGNVTTALDSQGSLDGTITLGSAVWEDGVEM